MSGGWRNPSIHKVVDSPMKNPISILMTEGEAPTAARAFVLTKFPAT
ncbi:MAG: hypothetical protein KA202_04120 [Enterocloster sp.]|nr:hypothetical protein [Enterocloster clostridioformis]MBP6561109.1 hypothetical protein [Enterocloster sp.]NSJ20436.1 hypothetical protein [Enterocloster clostridioformis]NSJ40365.1 hypothetical protein [Enterocloster clostridioformis]